MISNLEYLFLGIFITIYLFLGIFITIIFFASKFLADDEDVIIVLQ